jgi:hypothetical protein
MTVGEHSESVRQSHFGDVEVRVADVMRLP